MATINPMDYHRIAQEAALKLEIQGISFRHSVYAHIKRTYGLQGSKQRVYDQFKEMNDREIRSKYPSPMGE